jgi:hypothetical protein
MSEQSSASKETQSKKATAAKASESAGPVALLPVKFKDQTMILSRAHIQREPTTEVVIAGRVYSYLGSQWNPQTQREEHELGELVLSSQDDLRALLDKGWAREG